MVSEGRWPPLPLPGALSSPLLLYKGQLSPSLFLPCPSDLTSLSLALAHHRSHTLIGTALDSPPPSSVPSPAAPKLTEPLPTSPDRLSLARTVRCRTEPLPRPRLARARRTVRHRERRPSRLTELPTTPRHLSQG
jgi:hypothetical protein